MEIQNATSNVAKIESVESWDFHLLLSNNQQCPVFAHFTASWCVPSLAMHSYIEELARTNRNIRFIMVDVDEAKEVASKMEVITLPTFVIIQNGKPTDRWIGANPVEIKKRIDACFHPTSIAE